MGKNIPLRRASAICRRFRGSRWSTECTGGEEQHRGGGGGGGVGGGVGLGLELEGIRPRLPPQSLSSQESAAVVDERPQRACVECQHGRRPRF